jgi:hypothetical protein
MGCAPPCSAIELGGETGNVKKRGSPVSQAAAVLVEPVPSGNENVGPKPAPYSVTTQKFLLLSFCTFGLYQGYWCFRIWKSIQATTGERMKPAWRGVFTPIWVWDLFPRIQSMARSCGATAGWSPKALAAAYVLINFLWRLPDPWWLLGLAGVLPMIPVQRAVRRVAESYGAPRHESYTKWNIVTIAIGGLLLMLSLFGLFFAPKA